MTKLLVIDDDVHLRESLAEVLELEGFECHQAGTAHSGIEAAKKVDPEVVIMDIQLPEVSGLEVTKWLKEDDTLKAIPVVAVTAFAMKGDEEKIREGGCDGYLAKPISVTSFLKTVADFLA